MDANVVDRDGTTPLHYAAHRGLLPVVKWLCEKRGSMVTVCNANDKTPMHLASERGHNDIVTYLQYRINLIGKYQK